MNGAARALCLLAMLAVAVAGCGSASSSDESTPGGNIAAQQANGKEGQGASGQSEEPQVRTGADIDGTVFAASSAELGVLLFDNDGFTLYAFGKDKGGKSSCYGACAKQWPPHLANGRPRGVDVSRAKLGTVERKGGTTQITYAGHPLYTYVGDKQPGDTKGDGAHAFGGEWYAIRPSGEKA